MKKNLLFFFVLSSFFAMGQKNYYTNPVKIPVLLSGNFAELRSNHFHSGIDIKTQGVTGIAVHAAAAGYVSRIAVSPTGYGNALYIDHPNGTTTVYGHLESFSKPIAKYVKARQYEQESFKVDLQVSPGRFPVEKDEIIAKSGNSGSSGGPHLHFEIRDTKTEMPLNPLKYNFKIKDDIPPKVFSLMMIPLSDESYVIDDTRKRRFPIVFYDGKYHIKNNPAIPVYGEIGFAVETNDYLDGSWNKCGINSLQLTVDSELYFANRLDSFSFDETRYINSLIDYETYIDLRRRFQRMWVEPGNRLSTYEYLKGNGAFIATGNGMHKIQIQLDDSYGNRSVLEFNVQCKPKAVTKKQEAFVEVFKFDQPNKFETDDIQLEIPKGALYSDLNFQYKTMPLAGGYYSEIHILHKNTVPLHTSADIKIRTKNLPRELESKALLVVIDDLTDRSWAAGGTFEEGWVSSKIRVFGHYAVKVDTIPPTIKPLSIKAKNSLTEAGQIRFKISDDLAGIEKIEGRLDGKWALFEYDAKKRLITHKFDKERFTFNKNHQFSLTVTDYRGNKSSYKATFWK